MALVLLLAKNPIYQFLAAGGEVRLQEELSGLCPQRKKAMGQISSVLLGARGGGVRDLGNIHLS